MAGTISRSVTSSDHFLATHSVRSAHCRARRRRSTQISMLILGEVLGISLLARAQQSSGSVPQNPPAAKSSIPTKTASDPVRQAQLLFERGNLDEAEGILRDYVQASQNSADAHYLLGYIYFQQIHQQLQPSSTPPPNAARAQTVDAH